MWMNLEVWVFANAAQLIIIKTEWRFYIQALLKKGSQENYLWIIPTQIKKASK